MNGSSLRVTNLRLANWRNFRKVDVALAQRTILVGPNASGKSNFLGVFRFLQHLVSDGGGFQKAVEDLGGVSGIRSLAARSNPRIEIEVQVGNDRNFRVWEYELHLTQDKGSREPRICRERISHLGRELLNRPEGQDEKDPDRLRQTFLEQVTQNLDFRELAEFFGSIRYLHIVPQLLREPDRAEKRPNDPFGGDFLERILRTPKKTHDAWLKRINKALRVAVPQLEELKVDRDPRSGIPHLKGRYAHWRPQGAWQTERELSDGTLRLFGLLWSLLEHGGPLLLEEPELSLHPGVVEHLPAMFARVQLDRPRQVLVSTHSPDLLRDPGIGLQEVLLLIPGGEGTTVELAAAKREIRQLLNAGISLPEALSPQTRPHEAQQLALFGS